MPASTIFKSIQQGLQFADDRERQKLARQQQFMQLDNARKGALFQDARVVNSLLNSGQTDQALNFLGQRVNLLNQVGGDPTDTMEIVELINSGNLDQAKSLLSSVEQAGVQSGFLQDGSTTKERRVQNSRDVPGGTLITYSDGTQEFKKFGEEVNQAALDVRQRDLPKLTSSLQNKQLEFQESANNAYSLADKTAVLADRFSKIDTAAGAAGSARESFLNFVGGQDEVSNLRKDYTRIRNKLITANLPQGPATDKDIELIAAGFPPATASQAQIVDFLQAMSRGQEAIAKFDEFKSVFLQENGNITRATRDFTFDGQEVRKGERLATAYKRISKKLNPRAQANAETIENQSQQEQPNQVVNWGDL